MKEFDVSLSNKNYILCLNKPFENFFNVEQIDLQKSQPNIMEIMENIF